MRINLIHIAALALFLGGCAKTPPRNRVSDHTPAAKTSPPRQDEATVTPKRETLQQLEDHAQIESMLGEPVLVTGRPQNAKLAGEVVTQGGVHVYCLDIASWSAQELEGRVSVMGVLERTDQFAATVDEQGAISQGSSGGDLVLHDCELIERL